MSQSQPWLNNLNSEQADAVLHNNGPLLILAGAGSGKTTVLVSRTQRLIAEKVAEMSEIAILTFTNKAARELKERVAHRLQIANTKRKKKNTIWAGTFHSFGLKILREFNEEAKLPKSFAILDTSDAQAIIRELMKDTKVVGKDKFDLDKLYNLINEWRTEKKFSVQGMDEYHELAEMIAPKYLKKLEILGAVDFEALLHKPIELFLEKPEILTKIQSRFKQVMVDEFQDTNRLQMKFIDLLVEQHKNLTVVGDDDQSIYGWRGAEVKNILQFPYRYKGAVVIRLEKNYRSQKAIIDLANAVIEKNDERHGKVLRSTNEDTPKIPELFMIDNEDEEAEFVAREIKDLIAQGIRPSQIAVLYRSNMQSGLLESVLKFNNIEYEVSGGGSFFDKKEVKDVLAYLRLVLGFHDVPLRRIVNVPARGIGDNTLEKIIQFSESQKISFSQALPRWLEAEVIPKVGEKIEEFLLQLKDFKQLIAESDAVNIQDRILKFFEQNGYKAEVIASASEAAQGERRWMGVEIFARVLSTFIRRADSTIEGLQDFVDAMELRDEQDQDKELVRLMTLHASKGLEYPYVFLIGVEEELLPHRSLGSDINEERRLFYVGITRAKKHLIMTACKERKFRGRARATQVTRFLQEVQSSLYQTHESGFRPISEDQRADLIAQFLNR